MLASICDLSICWKFYAHSSPLTLLIKFEFKYSSASLLFSSNKYYRIKTLNTWKGPKSLHRLTILKTGKMLVLNKYYTPIKMICIKETVLSRDMNVLK